MADIDLPTNAGQYIPLVGSTDDDVAGLLPLDVDGKVMVIIRYNVNTNRLQILESTGDYREIPTVDGLFEFPSVEGLLFIDTAGNLTTYPAINKLNPMIEVGSAGLPVRWPQVNAMLGSIFYTKTLSSQLAVDGVTSVDRAIQGQAQAPIAINTPVGSSSYNYSIQVDCSVGTKQTIFSLDAGQKFLITDIVMRDPSGALTTAECSFGYNAGADDVVANDAYPELTGTDIYTPIKPKPGAAVGVGPVDFGVIFNVTQSSRVAYVDVVGILK